MERLIDQLEAGAAWVASTLARAALAPLDEGSRLHWPYLVAFLIVGALSLYAYGERRLGPMGLIRGIFPRRIWLHPSARMDLVVYLVNQLWLPSILTFQVAAVTFVTTEMAGLLVRFAGAREVPPLDGWVLAAMGIVLFAARDFGAWLNHWLFHKTPFLWPFHELHHSAEVLSPITLYREHPVFYLLNAQIKALSIGVPQGVIFYAFTGGADPVVVATFETLFTAYFLCGAHLRHSHLWLSYGPWLGHILISPAQHQIHHSREPRHREVNFGVTLAVWDWLFGTLYVPAERETFAIGLLDATDRPHASLLRGYLVPFARSARALRALLTRTSAPATTERSRAGRSTPSC